MATDTHRYELSLVIPSYNREPLLKRCLEALATQTQDPATFEAVIVDDGSSDGTSAMVEAFETPFELRLFSERQGGWAAAQNFGIEASDGKICLLVDDDIIASPNLVAAHIAGHAKHDGDTIGIGPLTQEPPRGNDWYARTFAAEWDKHYALLERRQPTWMDCYGGNLSAPREALLASGGFAPDLAAASDVELAYKLCEAGATPRYFAEATAIHDDQKPGSRLLRDAELRGVAYLQMVERHPATEAALLGTFAAQSSPRELAVRRALIRLGVSPSLLVAVGRAAPGAGPKAFLHHAIQRYAFWQSVHDEVDQQRWLELSRNGIGPSSRANVESGPTETPAP